MLGLRAHVSAVIWTVVAVVVIVVAIVWGGEDELP